MSGDIALPNPHKHENPRLRRGIFSFRQLNALALILILSASGMITVQHFAFVILSAFYMYFISKVAFPTLSPTPEPPVFGDNNRLLGLYVSVGALVGLVLPLGYMLQGFLEGDEEGIKAAAPHVFLLASQVFMEGVAFSGWFSIPVRVFVPVAYNSMRITAIVEWVKKETTDERHGRRYLGRSLAIANMLFWGFNLFGFLLPVYLPKAFKKYYAAALNTKH